MRPFSSPEPPAHSAPHWAARFSEAKANTVTAARAGYDQLAARLHGASLGVPPGVTSESDWTEAVNQTEARFGPLDILIDNAAYLRVGTVEDIPLDAFQRVLDTNLTGAFLGIRAAAPSMRTAGGGAIVNVNSVHPGIIETPRAYGPDGNALVPVDDFAIHRNATPDEIAHFVLFAASDQARFPTGSEIIADGGFTLGPLT